MKRTVQQSPDKSIGQTPDSHSENPYAALRHKHWSDAHWDEIGLSPAIENRLARVDRALQSMYVISELLTISFVASVETQDVPAPQFSPGQREGLHCALLYLSDDAAETMGELRDNARDCWGTKGGRA